MSAIMIENTLKEKVAEDLSQQEREAFELLKKHANTFLKNIKKIYENKHKVMIETLQKVTASNIYKGMREDRSYTRELLKQQHAFAAQLDIFMERETYLTYVTEEGELIFYGKAATGKLYAQATGNRGRGNISSGLIDKKNNKARSLDKKLREKILKRQKTMKEAYEIAIKRYNNNTPTGKMRYKPSERTFYWRKDKKTVIGWTEPISNKGRIAEAYANIVLSSQDINDNNVESRVAQIAANLGKDNINAVVKADAVINEYINGKQQQFAIKSGDFSTARLGSYIRFAQNIINLGSTILKKEHFLANDNFLLKKMSGVGTKILKKIEGRTTEEINQLLKEQGFLTK